MSGFSFWSWWHCCALQVTTSLKGHSNKQGHSPSTFPGEHVRYEGWQQSACSALGFHYHPLPGLQPFRACLSWHYIHTIHTVYNLQCPSKSWVRVIGSCEHAQPAISASNNSSCFTSRERAVMPNWTQAISHFFSTGGLSENYSLHERNYAMVTFSCNLLTTTELEGELARKAMIHMGLRSDSQCLWGRRTLAK